MGAPEPVGGASLALGAPAACQVKASGEAVEGGGDGTLHSSGVTPRGVVWMHLVLHSALCYTTQRCYGHIASEHANRVPGSANFCQLRSVN